MKRSTRGEYGNIIKPARKGGGLIFSKKSLLTVLVTLVIVSILFALEISPLKVGPLGTDPLGDKIPGDESTKGQFPGEDEPEIQVPQLLDEGIQGKENKGTGENTGSSENAGPKENGAGKGANENQDNKSGPLSILPWDENPDFLRAKADNKTKVLMAAYKTVLIDPLPGEEFNVHLGAKLLSGKVVGPGEVLSQNGEIGPYDESKGFKKGPTYMGTELIETIGGGVCKISSTLYNVAVLSNLEIVRRYNHSMPVPYVPYGQDATVSYGGRDFQFKNNKDFPILIWAEGIDNVLYMAFYGQEKGPDVVWEHDISNIIKAPVIYKTNTNLPPGREKILSQGMDGATVISRIKITHKDGTKETRDMGVSLYRPMPTLMEKGKAAD